MTLVTTGLKRNDSNAENAPPPAAPSAKAGGSTTKRKPFVFGATSSPDTKPVSAGRVLASPASVKAAATKKSPTAVKPGNSSGTTLKGKAPAKRPFTPTRDAAKPPIPPLSPSKRQNVDSHYDSPDAMNPRKRQKSLDGPIERSFEVEALAAC
jgi:hypothetical protein